jgi:hypothetical protein
MGSSQKIFSGQGQDIAEELPDPISRDLHDAFWGAIGQYGDWCRGQAEPQVMLDRKLFAISTVCDFVSEFEDAMPTNLWHLLAKVTRGAEDLPNDKSYRSGARYLAHLIKERKEQFDRPRG